jgi:hypothetical protein
MSSTPRRTRTPTIGSLTPNQHNKFIKLLSMGFNVNAAYQHRNINQNKLNRLLRLIVIEGRYRYGALQEVLLSASSPSHRRRNRPPSKEQSNKMKNTIKHIYESLHVKYPRNEKKGGTVIR